MTLSPGKAPIFAAAAASSLLSLADGAVTGAAVGKPSRLGLRLEAGAQLLWEPLCALSSGKGTAGESEGRLLLADRGRSVAALSPPPGKAWTSRLAH